MSSPCWPTYTVNFIISPGSMSLSTVQWDDKRKLTSDIILCPQRYICRFRWPFSLNFVRFVSSWKGLINFTSPVEFKKWSGRRVNFRGLDHIAPPGDPGPARANDPWETGYKICIP